MKSKYYKYICKILNEYQQVNKYSPFPLIDTELVGLYEKELNKIMKNTKEDYDKLPVACCKHCKELQVVTDELENDVCLRCGAHGNDIVEVHKNIFEYSKATGKKID